MKHVASTLVLALAAMAAPSAFAATTTYRATLSGPAEATPNPSPGTGIATIIIDDVAQTMQLNVPFYDLVGTTTAAHIHCCTAIPLTGTGPVATMVPNFAGFPTGVHAGLYEHTFNMADAASYNPNFITNNGGTAQSAFSVFLAGLNSNQSYLNLHTSAYPGGEIRGFLVAAPVPEPESWAMLLGGLAALGFMVRRQRT
jgi:hypothetical protein